MHALFGNIGDGIFSYAYFRPYVTWVQVEFYGGCWMKAGHCICAVEDARYRILEYNLCPRVAPAIYATNNT